MNVNSLYQALPEWHSQEATILVWPHKDSDWANQLSAIENTYLTLTKIISTFQRVIIIGQDKDHIEIIKNSCAQTNCELKQCLFFAITTNDTWVRDYGPQVISNHQQLRFLDFGFNAWGGQYSFDKDEKFTQRLLQELNPDALRLSHEMILEGGNLDFNQQGDLITNIRCIQTNSQCKDIKVITQQLNNIFSPRNILTISLPPLLGDDTGGHIDTLARFICDDTIVYAYTSDTSDPNYATLQELEQQIQQLCQKYSYSSHQSYKTVALPMPVKTFVSTTGQPSPASYVNFLFINNALLVPQYGDINDALAIQLLQQQLPSREIIGINACALIEQYGSLHCATLHLPQGCL